MGNIALTRGQRVMAIKETTRGTLAFPAPAGSSEIIAAGPWNINQQPAFTDSPEIVNSRDVLGRFADMMPPGDWSGQMLIRPKGVAGEAPCGDVLYESLQGGRSVNAGVSIVYGQALTKPSFTLWVQKEHTVFFLTGCTVSSAKPSITNKGPVTLDLSGQGMRMGWAGYDSLSADEAAGQTILSVDHPKRFCAGARIWNETKADDNGGLGYEILEVDVPGGTITVATPIPAGGWAEGDIIRGFLPVGVEIGSALESRHTTVKIGGVAATLKSLDLTVNDPAKYMEDEITATQFVEDYVEDVRDISGTLNVNFRRDSSSTSSTMRSKTRKFPSRSSSATQRGQGAASTCRP